MLDLSYSKIDHHYDAYHNEGEGGSDTQEQADDRNFKLSELPLFGGRPAHHNHNKGDVHAETGFFTVTVNCMEVVGTSIVKLVN